MFAKRIYQDGRYPSLRQMSDETGRKTFLPDLIHILPPVRHLFRWLFVILRPNNKLCIVNYELKNMIMKKIFMAAIFFIKTFRFL